MKIFLLLFFTLILFSFVENEDYKTIENQGISIQYPADWEILQMKGYPILVKEKAKSSEPSILCNFVVETDYENKILANYITQWKIKMSNSGYIKDWEIISEKQIQFKGYDGVEFITKYSAANYNCMTKIVIIKQIDRVVNLNTTSLETDFSKNISITDKIYESVEFENRK